MRNSDRPLNDDAGMRARSSSWSDREVEALLAGRGEPGDATLLDHLQDLRRLASGPVPAPSSALEAVLKGEAPLAATTAAVPPRSRSRSTGRRRLRTAAVLLVATLGVTTAGAAANALPAPAQRAAARVLNAVTSFHFPTPARPTAPATPVHVPSVAPVPATAPPSQPTAVSNRDDGDDHEHGTSVAPRGPSQSSAGDDATPSTRTSDQESQQPGTSDGSSSEDSPQEPAPASRQRRSDPEGERGVEPSSDSPVTDEPG